jgi:predicted lysophospholipase L1 biosynthesis ABC-type transport system permease subunit
MLGAYALVSDSLRRRRTELVLHRLHGAGHAAIVRVVMREFLVPLLVAMAVGLPVGAWIGHRYLADFVDRVDITAGIVGPMVAACAAMVAVIAIAAARHVRQALTIQPVEALR